MAKTFKTWQQFDVLKTRIFFVFLFIYLTLFLSVIPLSRSMWSLTVVVSLESGAQYQATALPMSLTTKTTYQNTLHIEQWDWKDAGWEGGNVIAFATSCTRVSRNQTDSLSLANSLICFDFISFILCSFLFVCFFFVLCLLLTKRPQNAI